MTNFTKYNFLKKGVDRFSNKLCFCDHQNVSCQVAYFACKYASDPFQRTVDGGGVKSSHLALVMIF